VDGSEGSSAAYWSSSLSSLYTRGLVLGSSYADASYDYRRAYGFSVRCFKNAIAFVPSVTSVVYTPSQITPTNGDVIATVTLDQTGANVITGVVFNPVSTASRSVSGTVFTLTFTGNRSGTVTFLGELGRTVSTGISIQNIKKTKYPGCDKPDITFSGFSHTFTIAACNVGATKADTDYTKSAGKKFQRGNNYGWKDSESPITSSTTVNTSLNGPTNPYNGSTFITIRGDWSNPQNNNLRGGKTTDGPTTIPATSQDELDRK
jgi:hypothetical protein